ncbi:MAG: PQQ-binding-like beta-propeller repeat protein [Armatimonadia bacterium]
MHFGLFGRLVPIGLLCIVALTGVQAEDWPEIYGKGRTGVWNEQNILRQFPAEGLKISWRAPIGPGYSGPAVAGGKVFITDYQKREGGGAERVICLDEQAGTVLWTYENPGANYSKFAYNSGPRSTPTVDGDRVYVLGAAGDLYCLGTTDGALRWKLNLPEKYQAKIPPWGYAASPLVYGDLLITPAGGANGRLVGLNKLTGEEVWRALPVLSDLAYTSPITVRAGGVDQLIYWVPGEVASLDPQTGAVYWQIPFASSVCCATPTVDGDRLIVTNFFKGSALIKLAGDKPAAELVWKGNGENENKTEGLHGLMCRPVLKGDYLYGICSYGQFRCLKAATGERVWESIEPTRENKRWANAFIVRNGDLYLLNNDRGELILADLQPDGYHEVSRTKLLNPTSGGAGTRELGKVNWVIPAYANGHIVIRNDEEIIRASLTK